MSETRDVETREGPAFRLEDFPIADVTDQIGTLSASAEALVHEGRLREAERMYESILKIAPHNLPALTFLAMRALHAGDFEASMRHLRAALQANPKSATLYENMAITRRAQKLPEAALEAIEQALAYAPRSATAQLHKGRILEDLGRTEEALRAFGRALTLDPTLRLPATLAPGLRELAQEAVGRLAPIRLEAIDRAVREVEQLFGEPLPERAREFVAVFKGLSAPRYEDPLQRPEFIFYPKLQPKPWFERGEFPWIRAYEAEHANILAEYQNLLVEFGATGTETPYVSQAAARDPRWRDLAGSTDWSSVHLFQAGTPQPGVLERCQKTFAALKHLPLARGRNHAPEVFFSTLKPGTDLPPHHGLSNAKLTIHLGLDVPRQCGIRVGEETRTWREGRCLIFDDSFEHTAWNHDTVPRVVLIADIWNPLLTPIEQELVAQLIEAHDTFTKNYFSG